MNMSSKYQFSPLLIPLLTEFQIISLPRPWFSPGASSENPYLSLYHEKMKLWGSWLLAQWIHADAFQLSDLSSMGQEQVIWKVLG